MTMPSRTIDFSIDFETFSQDPYPLYTQIRESGQPYYLTHSSSTTSPGVWLFSRYEDAFLIFKEASKASKNIQRIREKGFSSAFDHNLLFTDGEKHLHLRRLVANYFNVDAIQRLEPFISETTERLIADFQGRSTVDLIRDFAEPLPLLVIAHLMGIPKTDIQQIRLWSRDLGDGFDSFSLTPERIKQQHIALTEFISYIRDLLNERHQRPASDDLIASLSMACTRGELDPDACIGMIGFLLFAGHETTINLIGNGLWLLLSHPSSWDALKRHPEGIPSAIEEILRFESPEQRTSFRIALEPIDVGGYRLEPGDQFGAIIGAANRDPSIFDHPEIFDIRRQPNRHLAFGLGVHLCLGKLMARTEASIALDRLLNMGRNIELKDATAHWRHNSFFRGLAKLPVLLHG